MTLPMIMRMTLISRANTFNIVYLRLLMSSKKSSKKPYNNTSISAITSGPIKFRADKEGFVQLNLHVKPGAKISKIAEITEDYIGLQVKRSNRNQASIFFIFIIDISTT
jgi:hypothetical protein